MADVQALINAGISPLDAASLAADLQRYETAGAPQLSFGIGGLGPAAVDQVASDFQIFTAPLSNKGNPTATIGNITNTFGLAPDQQIRLVDDTGKVIYSGTGSDAANEVIRLAQGLTDAGGRKAAWKIQTTPSATQIMWGAASPQDGWKTIAQENKNKGVLGTIGDVVGTALPLAVSLIPGLQVLGPVASSVVAGGAGAALRGDNVLKGALMSGLTSAGGEYLGPVLKGAGLGAKAATAIGTGLGATVGGLTTGQNLKNSLLGGVASGGLSYFGGDIQKALGINAPVSGGAGGGGDAGAVGADNIVVTGRAPISIAPPAALGGGDTAPAPEELAPIVATGSRLNLPFTPAVNSFFNPAQYSGGENIRDTQTPQEKQYAPGEEIIVTGQSPVTPSFPIGSLQNTISNLYPAYTAPQTPTTQPTAQDEIVVTGRQEPFLLPSVGNALAQTTKPEFMQDLPQAQAEKDTTLQDIADYLRLAGLGTGLLGSLVGGGGGAGSGARYTGAGTALNPVYSAKLPAPTLPGASSNFAPRPASEISTVNGQPRDWTQYGFGPEASFFNYVPQRGYAYGGDVSHDEPSRSFAVRGPGDGRSDDIPAMLSDGEYVMDAETVALLGNGSPKAGAEVLDQFRVNLRKHKGRKLAKGEFSANAKKPEHYLAGGRI